MESDGPRVQPSGAPESPPNHKPRPLVIAAAVSVTVLAGLWLFQSGQEAPVDSSTTSSNASVAASVLTTTTAIPSLMKDTPWALMFDDGGDGVVVVDPNDPSGTQGSIPVVGQRPGDQPYRLELVAGRLAVGWEEIYAVDLGSGESKLLGEATIFVPAAEPDRVWLIDYAGGRIGQGTLRAWQVSVFGEALTPVFDIETAGVPGIGVAAGLAIESDAGIKIWDIGAGDIVGSLGSGASFVSDTTFGHGSALAWCTDPCDELHITYIPSMDDVVFANPMLSTRFSPRAARFSGDGRYLAAPTDAGDIVVFDRETERSHFAFRLPAWNPASVEWSPSSYEIFATTRLNNGLTTRIAYQMLGTDRLETLDVSLSLGYAFVVLNEDDARSFLGHSMG